MSEDKKKLSLPEQEERILEFWERNKIFEKSVEQRKSASRRTPRFVFYDGPPFATGLPHYGHILASTIKDVVPRYWTMKGYLVERRWGWDCHGLPIENIVEQELKISGRKEIESFGLKNFNETARSKVLTYTNEWEKTVSRIGRFVDFKNSYKTMDPEYMESVWWAFAELYKKNLVYKDARTSLFCPRCETPLSNFEIAMDNSYRDQEDDSVYVKFPLVGKPNESILIWTTTPWTLPGNAGVAVHPDLEYTKFKVGDEYIWSGNRPPHELGAEVIAGEKKKGQELIGWHYEPPFQVTDDAGAYRIVSADFVSMAEGTGLVHIAPAFGEDDFNLGKKEKLPMLDTLDDTGRFNTKHPEIKFLFGKSTEEGNKIVIEHLTQKRVLWKVQKIVHRYPICWRCSTPLLYKVQPAWFVKISALKSPMLKENEQIDWHPEHLKHGRFGKGLEDAPDWNINRTRFWGTTIPVWECKKCGGVEVVGGREELYKKVGPAKNKYILMRHGESLSNVLKINSDAVGDQHPLTEKGRKEVEKAAEKLKKNKIDLIFSSPILRTKETAEMVAKKLGVEVKYDERLRELSTGFFDGDSYDKYEHFIDSTQERFLQKPPGGESLVDARTRVFKCIKEIEEQYHDKIILIVSHEIPLWMLASSMLGLTGRESLSFWGEDFSSVFMNPAETKEIEYKNVPRNDTGEIDFHRPYADKLSINCSCGGKSERILDVFDCWFESGSMPFAEKHYPFENKKIFEENFPANFISEYIAQTRGWFYTLHVLSTALFQKPSFKHVVTTGTILSEKGEKLSKSKKNFPDPWLLFGKYGVDAIRYYLMASPVMLADNINFSEKDVDEIYKKYSLISSNILSFYQLYEFKLKGKQNKPDSKNILDQWILSRLHSTIEEVTKNFDAYEIARGVRPLLDFVQDLSLWYVRRSRERVKSGSEDAEEALLTLREVLLNFSIITAPVTPFLAEIIYLGVKGKKESVHLEDWPKMEKKLINKELEDNMLEVRKLVSEALRLRAEAGIKVRQPLSKLQITNNKLQRNTELLELIKDEVNVKEIAFGDELKLDITITPKLKEGGLVREFVRNVQDLRKNLGLKPHDVIVCQVAGNQMMEDIISKWQAEIKRDIKAEDIKIGGKKEFRAEKEVDFEGTKLWIGIS